MSSNNNQHPATAVSLNAGSIITGTVVTHTPTIPSSVREDTSQSRIASSMTEKQMSKTRARIEPLFVKVFAGNKVEEDIAKLIFNTKWALSETDLLAIEASDEELAKRIGDLAESLENFETIQSKGNYALNAQPLEGRITQHEQIARAIKKRLTGAINPVFMPLADAETWLSTFQAIVEFKVPSDQKGKKSEEALFNVLRSAIPNLQGSLGDSLRNIRDISKTMQGDGTLEAFVNKISNTFEPTSFASNDERESSALTGFMGRSHLWVDIVKALSSANRQAMILIDPRRAQEASVLTCPTLDLFNKFDALGEMVSLESPEGYDKTTFKINDLAEPQKFTRDDQPITFLLDTENGSVSKARANAHLMMHILNWAGATLSVDMIVDPSEHDENIFLTVPITESVFGEVIYSRLAKAWFAFSEKVDRPLKFLDSLTNLAKVKRTSRLHAKVVRADLVKVLKDDIDEFNEHVRQVLKTGSAAGITTAIDKAMDKIASYEVKNICYFDSRTVNCGTDAKHFAQTSSVAFATDRSVSRLGVPRGTRSGFAESLMVRDPHEFNVVIGSGEMKAVGEMYNNIVALSTPTSYSYSVEPTPGALISEILMDHHLGVIRSTDGKAETLRASELTPEAVFSSLEDFFVQVVDFDKHEVIRLPSGFGEVDHKYSRIAMVDGVISFGLFTGSRPELGSAFSAEMAKATEAIVRDAVNRYAVRPVTFMPMKDVKVDLTEKNEKYVKRLQLVESEFTDYKIDANTIKSFLAAPSAPSTLLAQFDRETILGLRRYNFSIRKKVKVIMQKMARDLHERLELSNTPDVINAVRVMLTRSLTLAEQERFNDLVFESNVKGVIVSIADAVGSTDSQMLKIVFINELLELIRASAEKESQISG